MAHFSQRSFACELNSGGTNITKFICLLKSRARVCVNYQVADTEKRSHQKDMGHRGQAIQGHTSQSLCRDAPASNQSLSALSRTKKACSLPVTSQTPARGLSGPQGQQPQKDFQLTWPQPGGRGGHAHTSSGHRRSWSSSGALLRGRWLQTTRHLKFRHKHDAPQTPTSAEGRAHPDTAAQEEPAKIRAECPAEGRTSEATCAQPPQPPPETSQP